MLVYIVRNFNIINRQCSICCLLSENVCKNKRKLYLNCFFNFLLLAKNYWNLFLFIVINLWSNNCHYINSFWYCNFSVLIQGIWETVRGMCDYYFKPSVVIILFCKHKYKDCFMIKQKGWYETWGLLFHCFWLHYFYFYSSSFFLFLMLLWSCYQDKKARHIIIIIFV